MANRIILEADSIVKQVENFFEHLFKHVVAVGHDDLAASKESVVAIVTAHPAASAAGTDVPDSAPVTEK